MKKLIASMLACLMLSGCATIFYEKPPTFERAPAACIVDIVFGFTIVPLAVDALNGSCRLKGGVRR